MAEISLINIADVSIYRKIDPKYNQNKFDTFVNDIQRKNLRQLLGASLYYDFMNSDRLSGVYKDLLEGKEYLINNETIQYYGLKPLLSYWWLAIAGREGDLYHSNYGAIQFVNNTNQQFESSKEKFRISQDYFNTAEEYANDVKLFLNENSDNYPLWDNKPKSNISSFMMFKL